MTRNEISIGLPFTGRWFVLWGGDTDEVNHHLVHRSQRRAADLVMLLVDHDEFLVIDPESLEGKQVIDTKGIWNEAEPVDAARAHVAIGAGAGG